jgi:hypothetical protein
MSNPKIVNRIMELYHNGELDNQDAKDIIEGLADFLNLKTLSSYARSEGISPAGALCRKNMRVVIDNHKFLIDNE